MNRPRGGQSSHNTGDDREPKLAGEWKHVPTELLREFAIDLVSRVALRGVATMAGLAKDTVRTFVSGTSQPNLATRRKLGELLLELQSGGVMTEPLPESEKKWKLRPRLMELLPTGEAEARAAVARIFRAARLFPDEMPERMSEVEDWMDLQVRGEYWAERHYGEIARRGVAEEVERARQRRQAKRAQKQGKEPAGEGE